MDHPTTLTIISQFGDAFNRHDLDAVMALMTDDCVFENTFPAPDGARFEGQNQVRAYFAEFFAASPHATFEWEEVTACDEQAIVRWRYRWVETDGTPGHVRGVDILRVRGGQVAEKLSYVKG